MVKYKFIPMPSLVSRINDIRYRVVSVEYHRVDGDDCYQTPEMNAVIVTPSSNMINNIPYRGAAAENWKTVVNC